MPVRRLGLAVLVAIVPALLVGVPAVRAANADVSVRDNAFEPTSVRIAVGDQVTWTWRGNNPHTVTAENGSFDSDTACPPVCRTAGATFTHTFREAGTFAYYCRIHRQGGMVGNVVVVSQGGTTTAPPGSTAPPQATTTTARATTTTSPSRTTTTVPTTTSTTVADTTTSSSTTSSSSTTTELAAAPEDDDDGDGGGLPLALLALALAAVLGTGGYGLWRLWPRNATPPERPLP